MSFQSKRSSVSASLCAIEGPFAVFAEIKLVFRGARRPARPDRAGADTGVGLGSRSGLPASSREWLQTERDILKKAVAIFSEPPR